MKNVLSKKLGKYFFKKKDFMYKNTKSMFVDYTYVDYT
jgi:hypothetical protein